MNRQMAMEWASKLTREEATTALLELLEESCDGDIVKWPYGAQAPYWEATGDPLVPGQTAWPDVE